MVNLVLLLREFLGALFELELRPRELVILARFGPLGVLPALLRALQLGAELLQHTRLRLDRKFLLLDGGEFLEPGRLERRASCRRIRLFALELRPPRLRLRLQIPHLHP